MKEYAKYIPFAVPVALALSGQPDTAVGVTILLIFFL